jgi:hypothetical protein
LGTTSHLEGTLLGKTSIALLNWSKPYATVTSPNSGNATKNKEVTNPTATLPPPPTPWKP